MKPVHLAELNPKSLKEIAAEKPLILIPIGTIEWHANHLPLGVDSLLSQVTCDEISARVGLISPLNKNRQTNKIRKLIFFIILILTKKLDYVVNLALEYLMCAWHN